jgi:RNA polymerase sigma-70 factor (ECF subfamily)
LDIIKIIEGCRDGNQFAENMLFEKYYKHMYNISKRILINPNDVEDALIISFTKVFKYINKFENRGEHSLTKWIKTIVINESIRLLKKRDRMKIDDEIPELTSDSNFDSNLSDIDTEQIYSIIEGLPAGCRLVFNLFAIEGYSHKEISEILKISENTSKSQLRKARLSIIKTLENIKNNERSRFRLPFQKSSK